MAADAGWTANRPLLLRFSPHPCDVVGVEPAVGAGGATPPGGSPLPMPVARCSNTGDVRCRRRPPAMAA